jgi:hypothetical protein
LLLFPWTMCCEEGCINAAWLPRLPPLLQCLNCLWVVLAMQLINTSHCLSCVIASLLGWFWTLYGWSLVSDQALIPCWTVPFFKATVIHLDAGQ